MTAVKKEERYTYDDYKTWKDSEDWEIINGVAYAMSPSPARKHQKIASNIHIEIGNYLKGKPCEVYFELDVILSNEDIVKPDLLVVCDKNKLADNNIKGAPDLVIEILSPSTSIRDKKTKLDLYRKFGVKEYWIVDPLYQEITVYIFAESSVILYSLDEEEGSPIIPVGIFGNELKIDLKVIFD